MNIENEHNNNNKLNTNKFMFDVMRSYDRKFNRFKNIIHYRNIF